MKYALVSAFALLLSCSLGSQSLAATPAPRKRQTASPPHAARSTTPPKAAPKVVAAPAAHTAKKAPMKVKFGLYVTHLFDINFVKNQFKIQFWSWFHLGDRKYKPNKTTELMKTGRLIPPFKMATLPQASPAPSPKQPRPNPPRLGLKSLRPRPPPSSQRSSFGASTPC